MTKKVEFRVEDFVVYPTHGVGQILGTETQEIAGTELDLLVINFAHDRMTLRIPVGKAETSGPKKIKFAQANGPSVSKAGGACSRSAYDVVSPSSRIRGENKLW